MRGILDLFKRFRADERGAFAVIFGLLAIVLVAMAGAAVDYTSLETARNKAQIALDSAALGLAPTIYDKDESQLLTAARSLVAERVNDPSLAVTLGSAKADKANGTLRLDGTITMPMTFVQLVGIKTMSAKISAEATRGSVNLEVAVVLDTTGSMSNAAGGNYKGSKLDALKEAMNILIPLVVKDVQTPTYTKMAIIPYSMGVNVGTYAASARGDIAPGQSINGASWTNGSLKDINTITRANPAVVTTSSNHGYATGDYVYIYGVSGMTQINDGIYRVGTTTATTFQLKKLDNTNLNSSSYGSYSSSSNDKVQRCLIPTCEVVVTTSVANGFANNDNIRITGVGGMTQINDKTFGITYRDPTSFALTGVIGKQYGAYTSGGTSYCTLAGCEYLYFQNSSNSWKTFQISPCVSERTTNAYTDASPGTTLLGRNYPAPTNGCIGQKIQPLTSTKADLTAAVTALSAGGSTAGHTGIAWGWYLISPNFASLFPTASKPAAYDAPNTKKVLILMTDGEYNSSYCNGVISQDSTSGSGNASDHINCDAPNGHSWNQSKSLCDAIKASKKIDVYTVGFAIDNAQSAKDLMANCATDPANAFTPSTADDLKESFRKIGQNIADLRLSQ